MAIPAIMTSFLAVYGLTQVTGVSPIVQFLIALVGLGVAIDFSLLISMRWREERAHGREGDEAIVRAMETAGRAVVFSGTTVAIGLFALVALPLPFLRSVGYGGMLIPVMSVARRADAAAGRAALARQKARLAAHPHRRQGLALLDPLGERHRQAPRDRGRLGAADTRRARRRGDAHASRPVRPQHARQAGRREGRSRRAGGLRHRRRRARAQRGARAEAPRPTASQGRWPASTASTARPRRRDAVWRSGDSAIVLAFPIEDGSSGSRRTTVDDVRTRRARSRAARSASAASRRRTRTSSTPSTATSR